MSAAPIDTTTIVQMYILNLIVYFNFWTVIHFQFQDIEEIDPTKDIDYVNVYIVCHPVSLFTMCVLYKLAYSSRIYVTV